MSYCCSNNNFQHCWVTLVHMGRFWKSPSIKTQKALKKMNEFSDQLCMVYFSSLRNNVLLSFIWFTQACHVQHSRLYTSQGHHIQRVLFIPLIPLIVGLSYVFYPWTYKYIPIFIMTNLQQWQWNIFPLKDQNILAIFQQKRVQCLEVETVFFF